MQKNRHHVYLLLAFGLLSLPGAVACSGKTPTPFDDQAAGDGGQTERSDASDGSSGFDLASDDAGSSLGGGNCQPGIYGGTFTCNITLLAFIQFPLSGPISFAFAEGQSGNGEFSTLTIAPGAKMNATDDKGDQFVADLSGSLDCATNKVSGTMSNASMAIGEGWAPGVNPFTGTKIRFVGDLTGTYDGNAAPVAIDDGTMALNSPDLGGDAGPTAACTWSAGLGVVPPDAGATDAAAAPLDSGGD